MNRLKRSVGRKSTEFTHPRDKEDHMFLDDGLYLCDMYRQVTIRSHCGSSGPSFVPLFFSAATLSRTCILSALSWTFVFSPYRELVLSPLYFSIETDRPA